MADFYGPDPMEELNKAISDLEALIDQIEYENDQLLIENKALKEALENRNIDDWEGK